MEGFKLHCLFVYLLLVGMYCNQVSADSRSSLYSEGSLGVAFYDIDVDEDSSITSVGEYASLSIGQRFKHTLAAQLSLRVWNTEDDDNPNQDITHVLFHDFHFAGISLGAEAQFFLPTLGEGPYAKIGRHCWAVAVEDIFNIWNGSGCSNIAGGGFLFNTAGNEGSGVFAEVLLTRFKFVNSWMLVGGVRF